MITQDDLHLTNASAFLNLRHISAQVTEWQRRH